MKWEIVILEAKSENDCTEHRAQAIQNVLIKILFCFTGQMLLWIHFTDTGDQELFRRLLCLVLDPFVVRLAQSGQLLQRFDIAVMLICVVIKLEAIGPAGLVQVEEHLLLAFILAVVDSDGVIILVEAAHFRNHTRRLQVADV